MIETQEILLEPLGGLPLWLIFGLTGLMALLLLVISRRESWGWRLAALAGLCAWLLNPQQIAEIRQPLEAVVGIIVDDSNSLDYANRQEARLAALEGLKDRLQEFQGIDLRITTIGTQTTDDTGSLGQDGTHIMPAITSMYEDISTDRIAATFILSDGQIHDLPKSNDTSMPGWADAPVHGLLIGEHNEVDRQLVLEKAPRYGLIGKKVQYRFMIKDIGVSGNDQDSQASILIESDGEAPRRLTVPVNRSIELETRIRHSNQNHITLTVDPLVLPNGREEISQANNQAILTVNGIRDRLKVLLISGQPYAGERVWRNLLKADPAVDLVHFTILRPLSKRDDASEKEVSLIGFPVRQLFDQTVDDFDLILFDRYRRHGVIAPAYFRNIAEYVKKGGSIMIAAGPDFASPLSITRTPLDSIIPVEATGEITESAFRPTLTAAGKRHPVTANLDKDHHGGNKTWAEWYRLIGADLRNGEPLMDDGNGNPLLVIDRVEDGRIAVLLSDHAWIWARGIEGGGPYIELLRRTAHWLMQEPELEEERLRAKMERGQLNIELHSMEATPDNVEIVLPNGQTTIIELTQREPGLATADLPASQQGIYKIRTGDKSLSIAAGRINAKEVLDLVAQPDNLDPILAHAKSGLFYTQFDGDTRLPDIRRMDKDSSKFFGRDYLGIRDTDSARITGTTRSPLLPPVLVLLWVGGFLMYAWYRENKVRRVVSKSA